MKKSSALIISLGVLASMLIVSACDPTAQEMAVRMRMQQLLNMFPSIYEDIRTGRFVPNRPGYQNQGLNGQYNNLANGQQTVMPYNQQGQMMVPTNQQGQMMVPNNNQGMMVPNNQGMMVPQNQGMVVVPSGSVVPAG